MNESGKITNPILENTLRNKTKPFKTFEDIGLFNLSKRGGTSELPYTISVKSKLPGGNSIQAVKNQDGSYMFHNEMPNRMEAGRAMIEMEKHLPSNPIIHEKQSLSLDSYSNLLNFKRRKG